LSSQRVRLAAGGLLALALLYLFFRGMDWSALGAALRGAHPGYLIGVMVTTVLLYAARAWRWGYLLAPLGRVGLADLFSATMVGFASGLLVPRAGEIVRPYLVSRRYPISTSAGFATIVLERVADLVTVLLLFGLYLFVLPVPPQQVQGPLLGFLKLSGLLTGAGVAVIIAVLWAFHAYADRALAFGDRLLKRLPHWLEAPLGHALRAFSEGLAVLQAPPAHLLAIFGQSLVVWLLIALSFHLNHLAFGLTLPFHAVFLLLAFLTVGVAIPTPGMVGGFHAFYLLCLTEAFGIPKGTAAAAGIAAHALANLPVLAFGLLLLGREGLTLGKVARMAGEEPQEVGT
jgi:glycosyltransferase 2 family protein